MLKAVVVIVFIKQPKIKYPLQCFRNHTKLSMKGNNFEQLGVELKGWSSELHRKEESHYFLLTRGPKLLIWR
jgi:hypothetical protein